MGDLHIVIAESGLILSRGADKTFHDFQDTYPDFMTSLGPMDRDGVFEMFEIEWPDILAINGEAIRAFVDDQNAPRDDDSTERRGDVRLAMSSGSG